MSSVKNEDSDVDDNNISETENGDALDRDASDDESDSDDLSEMECDRRRIDCIDNMTHLEKQFSMLRDQIYHEQINQVDMEIREIHNGKSKEYLGPLQQLSHNMRTRIKVAGVMRRLQSENILHKYKSEEQAARQHFESEKQLAKDRIYDELFDKIHKLEEDRYNVDVSLADWATTTSTRKSKVRGPGRKKPVTVSGPYIVYMLTEEDILEDWNIIRKSLKKSGSTC